MLGVSCSNEFGFHSCSNGISGMGSPGGSFSRFLSSLRLVKNIFLLVGGFLYGSHIFLPSLFFRFQSDKPSIFVHLVEGLFGRSVTL